MSNITLLDPATFNRPTYQRELRNAHVTRIAREWNDAALGAVTVSQRKDGSLWIMDGGHRSAAAVKRGVSQIPTIVKTDLTLAEEAALFLELNEAKALSAVDKYLASVIAGLEPQVSIEKIIREYGWKVAQSGAQGCISAPAALEYVYNGAREVAPEHGPHILSRTLWTITEAWQLESDGTSANLLKAIGRLIGRYGNEIDGRMLVRKLRATTPAAIAGPANGLAKTTAIGTIDALGKILVATYNKKLTKSRLADWEIR